MKVRNKAELDLMQGIKRNPIVIETIPSSIQGEAMKGRDIQVKPICLLMAYMCGMIKPDQGKQSNNLAADLEVILRAIPSYLDIIIEECIKLIAEYKQR